MSETGGTGVKSERGARSGMGLNGASSHGPVSLVAQISCFRPVPPVTRVLPVPLVALVPLEAQVGRVLRITRRMRAEETYA